MIWNVLIGVSLASQGSEWEQVEQVQATLSSAFTRPPEQAWDSWLEQQEYCQGLMMAAEPGFKVARSITTTTDDPEVTVAVQYLLSDYLWRIGDCFTPSLPKASVKTSYRQYRVSARRMQRITWDTAEELLQKGLREAEAHDLGGAWVDQSQTLLATLQQRGQ